MIAHIAENVEKQRILEPFVSVHKTFHSETDKLAVLDVGVTIEVLAFRTFAHGVKSKTDILQHFFGIKMFFLVIKRHEFLFNKFVEVAHNWIIFAVQRIEIGKIINSKSCVQLHKHDLYGVNFAVRKVLVRSEKIL